MISDFDLDEMERHSCSEDSLMALNASKLISEVRRLKHELDDPNYLYVGRIHRQAVISRNETIDKLRAELKALKASLSAEPVG